MEIEQRLEGMASAIRIQGVQLMALELAVRALIGTHPDPKIFVGVMQNMIASNEQEIRDAGFQRGVSPESAQRFVAYF